MTINKIKSFAREQGYDDVMYLTKWRGYDCYEPIFKDNKVAILDVHGRWGTRSNWK